MEQVTRQFIDARTQPVTITTVPTSRSQVEVFLGSTMSRRRTVSVAAHIERRRKAVPAVVVATVLGVAVFGFTLGWLGFGVGTLVSLATITGAAFVVYALLGLVGGGSVAHCPGAWHR